MHASSTCQLSSPLPYFGMAFWNINHSDIWVNGKVENLKHYLDLHCTASIASIVHVASFLSQVKV